MDPILKLAIETIQINKQALIFCPSRASAEKTAEDISKLTNLTLNLDVLPPSPTKQCKRLDKTIKKGIAFHHAGLLQKQKQLIEDNFRNGKVKVICATPTLAAGMSLPAYRVIIKSLKRFSGWGMNWIPVLEYMQMAGRAGRPEYEKQGEAIVIAKNEPEKQQIHETYILGEPEDIYSKLNAEPVLRTYLLSLIASGVIRDEESMKEFFSKTFWAHKYGDMQELEIVMDKMLHLLKEWEFVIVKEDDFTPADQTNKKRMRATMIGKRVSELYLDPLTARHLLDCLKQQKGNTFSLLQMISHTLEMRPLLRIKSKQQDWIQEELMKRYELLLTKEPSAYDLEYNEFLNSIKTALCLEAWIEEKDEDFLLEKFDIRPGETRMKVERADWLLYAAEELSRIQSFPIQEIRKLRVRIKNGVKEELLPLLKLKGIGRVRARRMYTNSIRDIGDVKKVDVTNLVQILGRAVAANVKKQVGEEIKEIPKGTRKGQLSIAKF